MDQQGDPQAIPSDEVAREQRPGEKGSRFQHARKWTEEIGQLCLGLIMGFGLDQEGEVDKVVDEYEQHLDEKDQDNVALLQQLHEGVRRGLRRGVLLCLWRQRHHTPAQCHEQEPHADEETERRSQQQIMRPQDGDHQRGGKATENTCRYFASPDEAEQPLPLPHIEEVLCQAPKNQVR